MDPMKKVHTYPLEREYEAWTVHGIEKYLRMRGVPHVIHAVSPHIEATWPADSKLHLGREKVIGLQFKRATWNGTPTPMFHRLKWNISHPPHQKTKVANTPGIYYAFPTFFNRGLSRLALHHTLFWKPDPRSHIYSDYWYDNPRAKSSPIRKEGMRWGQFIEDVLRCEIGDPELTAWQLLDIYRNVPPQAAVTFKWSEEESDYRGGEDKPLGDDELNEVLYLLQIGLPD
jgi:hypothetical protein